LLAAGRGSRLGTHVPKAFLRLRGQPLLVHATQRLARAFAAGDRCDLVVVAHPDDRERHLSGCLSDLQQALGGRGRVDVVDGGASRQQSMANGLAATGAEHELIVVHDAARPLVPVEGTRACAAAAARDGAALLAIPATDTLKQVRDGKVTATLDRHEVWYAQTPQIARRELFVRACEHALATGFAATDDVSLLEHAGVAVTVVPGSASNLKITRPDDVPLAEALLDSQAVAADPT
jgi:2-C-methyl-D-erythritol 4-phosphate cytidylyltransferase